MSQRRMFEVKCTECKKDTTVSFQPTKGKPVYCRTCFAKHRPKRSVRSSEPIRFDISNAWAIRGPKFSKRKEEPKSVFKK